MLNNKIYNSKMDLESELYQQIIYLNKKFSNIKTCPINNSIKLEISNLTKLMKEEESKDHQLIGLLEDLDGISTKEYTNMEIPKDYIIIYFPTADMIKFYKPEDIDKCIYQIRVHFKNKKFLEVVRNMSEQKIIIVYDSSNSSEINKLAKYIIQYSNMIFDNNLTIDDITTVIDKESDTSEIILNKYINNIKEKEIFCKKLMEYIQQQEHNTRMIRKFNTDHKGVFSNAECYDSINKILSLSNKKRNELVNEIKKAIISSTNECGKIDVYLTFNINNYTNCNIQNANCTINTKTKCKTPQNDYDKFIQYLSIEKPEWFNVGKWQHQCEIYEEFIKRYNKVSPSLFTRRMKNRIFSEKKPKIIHDVNKMALLLYNWDDIV